MTQQKLTFLEHAVYNGDVQAVINLLDGGVLIDSQIEVQLCVCVVVSLSCGYTPWLICY